MKQKVLLVNKFYYPRGGDCVVTMNLERLLRDRGHETAVYAMRYPDNVPAEYDRYFAPQVSFGGGIGTRLRAVARTLGVGDIRTSFGRILDDFRPDVVHLNNIHSYLSPVLALMAHRRGIRVVWTLHDYKLLCPSYSCQKNGVPCQDCAVRGKSGVLRNRCMKGSLAASAIAWLEALRWNRRVLERNTDVFVCPSRFMARSMQKAGFDVSKLVVNCNFVDPAKMEALASAPAAHRDDYCCYIGRLSEEKGVRTMLRAAAMRPGLRMKVAGDGPLADELRAEYASATNIEFVGRLDAAGVTELCSRARFSVLVSDCYENNPLGAIESLCMGTPVIGSDMGGIPELIEPGTTGLIVPAGDPDALARAMDSAAAHPWDHRAIADAARTRFSADTHYKTLTTVYDNNID